MSKTKILIVGGGFAGTKAALELAKCGNCEVTLLSDHSHFRYYPGLYHAATGGKRAGSRIRLSTILEPTITYVRGEAVKLNRQKKYVETKDGQKLGYDKLLLALGNVTNFFGIKGLQEYAYGIKSTEEAERFKQHLHAQLMQDGGPDLNYVIVGGGPTGIELAGALPGYLHAVMKQHGLRPQRKLHIELVEVAPHLLPRLPKPVAKAVTKRLRQLGITIMLGTAVQGATADELMAGDHPLQTHTIVWTAGVATHPFFKNNGFAMTDRGKVEVDEHLQAEPDIYILGDNANTPFSGMAQTALHDGAFVAANLIAETEGRAPQAYNAKQPISVIPAGPHWAIVQWGKYTFSGWIGWVLRALADLIAFHDLESWPRAGAQWLESMTEEDLQCPNCAKNEAKA